MRKAIVRHWELSRLLLLTLFSGYALAESHPGWGLSLLLGALLGVYACYVTREEVG